MKKFILLSLLTINFHIKAQNKINLSEVVKEVKNQKSLYYFAEIPAEKNIEDRLNPEFEGRFKIMLVPNITNICYGRGVGYKIEEIVLSEEIQKISATKIRAKMREEGKLK